MTEGQLSDYADWIGNQEMTDDQVTASSVAGMSATLDRDDPAPLIGDTLPPLWHLMYFTAKARQSTLGPDGHPERGGFFPPISLPRRMFAGAQYRFHQPLRIGDDITRRGTICNVTTRQGRSGELIFVKVNYITRTQRGVALEEDHDIVYRGKTRDSARVDQPASNEKDKTPAAPWHRTIAPDPVLLFRYSALTFNGHRIHYDRPYATDVEGYPGLVVHGPLIATLLLELLRNHQGERPLASFHFRARRPLFDTHPFEVTGGPEQDGAAFWLQALDPQGDVAMQAAGTFA